jgi:hypothetical protein
VESKSAPHGIASAEPGRAAFGRSIRRLRDRTGGIPGNERLTAATAVVLLLMLAAEGVTIAFMGQLLSVHILIGIALIPPVLVKLGSTGYRFARYYMNNAAYRAKGAPHWLLRATAPFTVILTLLVLGSGVALLLHGPDSGSLLLLHKVSFFVWLGFMGIHVLGHMLHLPRVASADWRRSAPEAQVAGSTGRIALVAASVAAGLAIGVASLSLAGPWLNFHG